MNKKVIAVILALAVLFGGLFMLLNKAEAATGGTYVYKYKIVFYTTNYKIYEYLNDRGFNVIFRGEAPKPAPQPEQPQPQPEQPAPVNGLTADEQKMVSLVYQERVKAGLKPLEVDMRLVKSARVKSQDMITNNYFAHNAPDGTTPWDLMKAQGVTYRMAGENLAGAPTVDMAHTNLMNSQGHRANILKPEYTHLGIGIVDGGKYGKMFTQHFITK